MNPSSQLESSVVVEPALFNPRLVIDVGMYDGNDTAFYLHRGFDVVGIDANPEIIEKAGDRFAPFIKEGRLFLRNVGISLLREEREFYVCQDDPGSSSLSAAHVWWRTPLPRAIQVRCVPFSDILQEFGVPYYLKVDIETADRACLESLRPPRLPKYVSWEAGEDALECLELAHALGYRHFKCVNQISFLELSDQFSFLTRARRKVLQLLGLGNFNLLRTKDGWIFRPAHSSGPFGEETTGVWRSFEALRTQWVDFCAEHPSGRRAGWYDFHATR